MIGLLRLVRFTLDICITCLGRLRKVQLLSDLLLGVDRRVGFMLASEEDRFNDEEGNYVTAVAVSVCGSYGFVGSNGGHLYRYNMQSGAPSGTFPHSDGKQ